MKNPKKKKNLKKTHLHDFEGGGSRVESYGQVDVQNNNEN